MIAVVPPFPLIQSNADIVLPSLSARGSLNKNSLLPSILIFRRPRLTATTCGEQRVTLFWGLYFMMFVKMSSLLPASWNERAVFLNRGYSWRKVAMQWHVGPSACDYGHLAQIWRCVTGDVTLVPLWSRLSCVARTTERTALYVAWTTTTAFITQSSASAAKDFAPAKVRNKLLTL